MENTAIGYARISKAKKDDESLSTESQEARIRAYAVLHGFNLLKVIVDNGESGTKPLSERKNGARLLAPEARNVIVVKLDRAFRNTADALSVTAYWDRAGVALHVIDMGGQSVDTRSAVGRVFFTMLSAFAQFERDLISERTTAALRVKRDRGEPVGRTPFGSRLDHGKLVPHAAEQATISDMRAWQTSGQSLRAIAARLNAAGVPTKQRPGARWRAPTVNSILKRSAGP